MTPGSPRRGSGWPAVARSPATSRWPRAPGAAGGAQRRIALESPRSCGTGGLESPGDSCSAPRSAGLGLWDRFDDDMARAAALVPGDDAILTRAALMHADRGRFRRGRAVVCPVVEPARGLLRRLVEARPGPRARRRPRPLSSILRGVRAQRGRCLTGRLRTTWPFTPRSNRSRRRRRDAGPIRATRLRLGGGGPGSSLATLGTVRPRDGLRPGRRPGTGRGVLPRGEGARGDRAESGPRRGLAGHRDCGTRAAAGRRKPSSTGPTATSAPSSPAAGPTSSIARRRGGAPGIGGT